MRELAICRRDSLEANLATIPNKMKTEISPHNSFSKIGIALESLDQVESRHLNNIECCVSPIFRHYILESLCYTM